MAKKEEWTVKEAIFDSRTETTMDYEKMDKNSIEAFEKQAESRVLRAIGYRKAENAAAV